jgi:hypothetical protein
MHRIAFLAALALIAGKTRAAPEPPGISYWTPDAALVARLEATVDRAGLRRWQGQHVYTREQYDRYYYGEAVNGQRRVIGKWVLPPNRGDSPHAGIHITEAQYMPKLMGNGCGNVSITYYVDADLAVASCEWSAQAYAPPGEQPHWKPGEQATTQLESALGERLQRAKLPELAEYDRYYRGVTVTGRQVIRGRVMYTSADIRTRAGLDAPSMHASAEDSGRVMADGGCANIDVVYDVDAARFTDLHCDGMGGMGVLGPDP